MIQLIGKMDSIMALFELAIRAGYGDLPAEWCIKLYLRRN